MLRLRFPPSRIPVYASRYPAEVDDAVLRIGADARRRGYLTRDEFLVLGEWKTPRARPHRLRNTATFVRETTRRAFASGDDAEKIETLLLLRGVSWPTASVILHLCDRRAYPILDVRAWWAAGAAGPLRPNVDRWLAYVRFTRALARATGCSMRDVDRALWQYSKEKQVG